MADDAPRWPNDPVPISGAWLRGTVDGDLVTVEMLVEIDGEWRLLCREVAQGPISHIVEPSGIAGAPRDEEAG
jgi:hypothetical protein